MHIRNSTPYHLDIYFAKMDTKSPFIYDMPPVSLGPGMTCMGSQRIDDFMNEDNNQPGLVAVRGAEREIVSSIMGGTHDDYYHWNIVDIGTIAPLNAKTAGLAFDSLGTCVWYSKKWLEYCRDECPDPDPSEIPLVHNPIGRDLVRIIGFINDEYDTTGVITYSHNKPRMCLGFVKHKKWRLFYEDGFYFVYDCAMH